MTIPRLLVLLLLGLLLGLSGGNAAAQSGPDYIKITPPPGMRWKTLDQSGVTNDIIVVDKQGDIWLKKSAAATFANSFVLVQLVGDTAGTDEWMSLVKEMPRFVGLQPDIDWQHYSAFTTDPNWQALVTEQRLRAFADLARTGIPLPPWVILPVYQSASDPSWLWWSPGQGQFPPDAELVRGEYHVAPRVQAGRDTPYTVTVQDFSTNPPTEVSRPGGYELYRNYYPNFDPNGLLSLTLAGDFSFQKDYLFPEGPPCADGLPRLQDGTCTRDRPITPGPDPTPRPTPTTTTRTGLVPGLATPEPTAQPAPPLIPPSLPATSCTARAGAVLDLCGEAQARALSLAPVVPLPPMELFVNPGRGVVRVPDWYWAVGYDGRDLVQSRSFDLEWSVPGPPIRITDPGTGQTIEVPGPSITGTDHITVAVRYRPARYRWDYGDGTVVDTGSLGQAYPSISDVQHAYQQGSLSQPGQQYTYQLTADWAGDWFVSGDATGTGALGPRQSIYAAGQVMREVDQLRCPEAGCR